MRMRPSTPVLHRLAASALGAVAAAAALAVAPPAATGAVTCAKYASPSGSDSAAGSASAPYRTAQKLVSSLGAGQAGCLAGGAVFAQNVTVSRGGAAGAPITLTTTPGAITRATLRGRLYVTDAANDVVFTNLVLDGRNGSSLPSPSVSGDRVQFLGNEVTNAHTGICFTVGSNSGYGRAVGTVIDGNRIHDCGVLPSTNKHHGIYVENSLDGRITNNLIYDNADRGVQLYPNAQRTLVANNVIDGNGVGVIFSGDYGFASSNNTVRDNVIAYSVIRTNIESWWPSGNPVGTGNVADRNCVWAGKAGNIGTQTGFTAVNTVTANPLYVNRAAKDFRLQPGSPCAGMGPRAATVTVASAASVAAPPRARHRRSGTR